MSLHKGLLRDGFFLPRLEKHFHDHDEVWLILAGRGTAYWIDADGRREDFELETGDVLVVPAGFEHGSEGFSETGENSSDFTVAVCIGTRPAGAHEFGHYFMEEEEYIPSLELKRTPTERYR